MHLPVPIPVLVLTGSSCAMMTLEVAGARTELALFQSHKEAVKRHTDFLAQQGQSACTIIACALIATLDPIGGVRRATLILTTVLAAAILCLILKRLIGRVRPGKPDSGTFLGPSWKHKNSRESFPSSHSACAAALAVMLAAFYPPGAPIFYALALTCAILRYVLDAHFPSDVLAGLALGLATATTALHLFGSL